MPLISLPDSAWVKNVGPINGVDLVPWDILSALERLDELEFVVPPYMGDRGRLVRLKDAPRLRVVQLMSAGYDDVVPLLPPGVQLANAGGVHDASTAELAVGLMLAALRGIPDFVHAQDDGRWLPAQTRTSLADRRVLIIGYGSIGRAIARRLEGFEVHVTAVASRARAGDAVIPQVHGVAELPDLLPDHDVVVLIVPLTTSTRGLVDRKFLAALPDGALVVNVARGPVIDTDALLEATSSGRILAALDVTDPEPLPEGHPLWHSPGVLITPHAGGVTTAFPPRAAALIREQVTAFAAGKPLRNVVYTS